MADSTRENAACILRAEAESRLAEIEKLGSRDRRTALPKHRDPAVRLYVSPTGSDDSDGSRYKPFATLEAARDAIRTIKKHGTLPQGGVSVTLMTGEYVRRTAFVLDKQDSGSADAPIVYRASRKRAARLFGGVRLSGFVPVTDTTILARLPEEAHGKVLQCDLRALGITDYGVLKPRGSGEPYVELFFDGTPLIPARWPNDGYVLTGEITCEATDTSGGTFTYEGDRPKRWLTAPDAWMWGSWYHDWADATTAIASIDTDKRQITAKHPTSYGMRAGQRYSVYNLLEELDQPGEWYLDRVTGIVYVYPPSDPAKAVVELSMLASPMVEMNDVSHVTVEGITFETARSNGIVVRGGEECLIAACTLHRFGGNGIIIDGGTGHGIYGCDIATLGRGGTVIAGGDRRKLTPGRHFIENCHIHDFSRIDRTYTPAVLMNGCGNVIRHNLFNDSPHHAMRVEGNDHIIEFNEVHSVVYEFDDQSGIDMFYNPTHRGVVIRFNYWHHIGSGLDTAGQAGIRLDDATCGVVMYGNVFYRCSEGYFGGIQIHGGKENLVANNAFFDCKYAVSFSPWGESRWLAFLETDIVKGMLAAVDVDNPPYSTRYPALAHLRELNDVNYIWRNVACRVGAFFNNERGNADQRDNLVTRKNPGFVDPARGDFRMQRRSPRLRRIGFKWVPFELMGLYPSPMRASWPVKHSVTPHYHGES